MKQRKTIINKSTFVIPAKWESHRIVIIILLFILQAITYSSCKKRLEIKANPSLSIPETLEDLQHLLDNDGDASDIESTGLNLNVSPSGPEAAADNYFLTQSQYNNYINNPSGVLIYIWQFNPLSLSSNEDWQKSYKAIYITNVCLDNLPAIARTTDNRTAWDNVNGSAHFFKAYYYGQLCWEFAKTYDAATAAADKGIPLRASSNLYEPTVRSSVQACYDEILSNAREAADYLPAVSINSGRPSKAAAYGLLARTYLSMRQYDSALKYADLCLQYNQQLINYNGDEDIIAPADGNSPPFRKFNKETILYTEMNTYYSFVRPGNSQVDSLLYDSYVPDDLRRQLFFRSDGGSYQYFKGMYSNSNDFLFSGIAVDEMLLTRSECYARAGNKQAALDDLNALLITRWKTGTFIPFTASTPEEALDIILIERRKELIFRGLRWMDIKRLNKEEGREVVLKRFINDQWYELEPNSDQYALPLPADIIKLTGIEQNDAYK